MKLVEMAISLGFKESSLGLKNADTFCDMLDWGCKCFGRNHF